MNTTRDVKKFVEANFNMRCFCTTISGNRIEMNIVSGSDSKNKNQGEKIFHHVFPGFIVSSEIQDKILEVVHSHNV